MKKISIGIDTGGTFTDIVVVKDGLEIIDNFKLLSTPENPSNAIINAMNIVFKKHIKVEDEIIYFGHGSTISTNILIENNGSKSILLTTKGFKDLLEIGRQKRSHLYDLFSEKHHKIIRDKFKIEINERTNSRGVIENKLNQDILISEIEKMKEYKYEFESISICYLFSYLNKTNEIITKKLVKKYLKDKFVSVSNEVCPEYREYERMSTTVINSFVGPKVKLYISNLKKYLKNKINSENCYITQSNGGISDYENIINYPIKTILSGPSMGVCAALELAKKHKIKNFITFDVGGTSTDYSFGINGKVEKIDMKKIKGYPIRTPMLDIETVGIGGGSICKIDEGGLMKVGPESAGANPGPACYGQGNCYPTVTDALLVDNIINENIKIGNKITINKKLSEDIINKYAYKKNLSKNDISKGILQIAISTLTRTIKKKAAVNGININSYVIIAYGGCGPLLASRLAYELNIKKIIIPKFPGLFCALGLLTSDLKRDYIYSKIIELGKNNLEKINFIILKLTKQANNFFEKNNHIKAKKEIKYILDLKYVGQNHELKIEIYKNDINDNMIITLINKFNIKHKNKYGFIIDNQPICIVAIRLEAILKKIKKSLNNYQISNKYIHNYKYRNIYYYEYDKNIKTKIINRNFINYDEIIKGPAVIEEKNTSTLLLKNQQLYVDKYQNLIIENKKNE